ncbi:lactonase family protein [Derxia gummosa]|uniref:Lactonase family protein n=1 Tax=Derxia gummosa DSM 723 TaxID=1121388 RepID=A0A8B6XCG7_9BURK|nr:beta-propeller fold lactonase family protein [Derxia gummosa]
MQTLSIRPLAPVALALALAAPLAGAQAHDFLAHDFDVGGIVYVMTNAAGGNRILSYARAPGGKLQALPSATVDTGGLGGSGNAAVDPLGSQHSLVYDPASRLLFAVNAGDNTVSVFAPGNFGGKPRRTALVSSGGNIPVSLAVADGVLHVLNAGGTGRITSFVIGPDGSLLRKGTVDLGLANATSIPFAQIPAPGDIGVDALSRRLIVTHAGGGRLFSFDLDEAGLPTGAPAITPAPGAAPFSFAVTPYGSVLVAEAGSGAVSSFDVPPTPASTLLLNTATVANGQAATCWIVADADGHAYVANTASGTVSEYRYKRGGGLELVNAVAARPGGAPTDITLAGRGRYLYALSPAAGSVSGYVINRESGALQSVAAVTGLPANQGLQGIAARDFFE